MDTRCVVSRNQCGVWWRAANWACVSHGFLAASSRSWPSPARRSCIWAQRSCPITSASSPRPAAPYCSAAHQVRPPLPEPQCALFVFAKSAIFFFLTAAVSLLQRRTFSRSRRLSQTSSVLACCCSMSSTSRARSVRCNLRNFSFVVALASYDPKLFFSRLPLQLHHKYGGPSNTQVCILFLPSCSRW